MPILIREIHSPSEPNALNDEWFVLENIGDKPFQTGGCTLAIAKTKNGRARHIGTIDPGFTLAVNEKRRVVTGNPGKKAHGQSPNEAAGLANYHLFLATPLLSGSGCVLVMSLHQHELARVVFDPKSEGGVAKNGA